jgi:DNA end-binding protein Ku
MRPIWRGAISFGLVNIPINVFSAVEDSSLDLDMLDSKDYSNIKFKRVNENTGKEVAYENIVKGYKINNKYVVIEPEDFKRADVKKAETIEILNFVLEKEVDSIYYEHPYYLEPEKSGTKAYSILRDALIASGKVGVASFVMRNKEALAIIKPHGAVLVLNRIRFEEEIKDTKGLKVPSLSKTKTKELDIAKQLIDHLTTKFNISKYKDTYTAKLLQVIKQKAKTGKSPTPPKLKMVHKKGKEEDDLVNILKASLGKRKKAS